MEKSVSTLAVCVADLKEQVKEELARNDKMEQQINELSSLHETVKKRDVQVAALQADIMQNKAVLSHAQITLREEREKTKMLRAQIGERSTMEEDMALTRAESLTLKRLIIGKDTLIVQKTQALDLAKEVIRELDKSGNQTSIAMQYINHPRALYPQGAHFNDPDKKQCLKDGSLEEIEKMSKNCIMVYKSMKGGQQPMLDSARKQEDQKSGEQVQHLLETILLEDPKHSSTENTQPVPSVKSHHCPVGGTLSDTDIDYTNNAYKYYQRHPVGNHHRRPRIAVVNPRIYQANQPYANFRTFPSSNDDLRSEKQTRLKLNRGESQSTASMNRARRAPTKVGTKWDKRRWSAVSVGGAHPRSESNVSRLSRKASSVWGEELGVFERDALASMFVHLGDRVIIDLTAKRGLKEKLTAGVVRYIGQVDKEVADFRVYVGVQLDEPVGDMDGVYKGKRYFIATEKHGKLVRIVRIKSVLHPKASKFKSLEDCIQNYRTLSAEVSSISSMSIQSMPS